MSLLESVWARSSGAAKVRVSGRVAIDAEDSTRAGCRWWLPALKAGGSSVVRTAENRPENRRFVDTLQSCLYNADSLLGKANPLYLKPLAPDPCWSPRPGRFGSGNAPDPGPAAGEEELEWMTS